MLPQTHWCFWHTSGHVWNSFCLDLNKKHTLLDAAPGSNNPFRDVSATAGVIGSQRRHDIASQSGRWWTRHKVDEGVNEVSLWLVATWTTQQTLTTLGWTGNKEWQRLAELLLSERRMWGKLSARSVSSVTVVHQMVVIFKTFADIIFFRVWEGVAKPAELKVPSRLGSSHVRISAFGIMSPVRVTC